MKRKTIQANPVVKAGLEALKKEFGLKTESEVIAYLLNYYSDHKKTVTLDEHNRLVRQVHHIHNQGSL